MENIPDHPDIWNCERYGYPYGPEGEIDTRCPVCGRETEYFYISEDDIVVGCEKCIRNVNSFDWAYDHREDI